MSNYNLNNKLGLFLFLMFVNIFLPNNKLQAQNHKRVSIIGVHSGNETNNTLFTVKSKEISSLAYIRAKRIEGPQDGIFTMNDDNIRYTSLSKLSGIPHNLSRIQFTFLESDKKTPIKPQIFRFIINDIDGPNNEALSTNCNSNLQFLGTANPTNLIIDNIPPDINAEGAFDESEGPTSRVMFEFRNVSVVEFDNYANEGYLKDFDLNDDYPINKPVLIKCINDSISKLNHDKKLNVKGLKEVKSLILIETDPIYFDLNSSIVRKSAVKELNKVIDIMKKYPQLKIECGSHTDSRASDKYNIILSVNRANSTVRYIVSKGGISPDRISAKGYGETQLTNKCSNGVKCTENEHHLNRRTEFKILNPTVLNRKAI